MAWRLYFHLHHDQLLEDTNDVHDRRAFIKERKPRPERILRLQLITPVPVGKLPKRLQKVWPPTDEDGWEDWDDLLMMPSVQRQIRALHKKLCHPNCPWEWRRGRSTIFTRWSEKLERWVMRGEGKRVRGY